MEQRDSLTTRLIRALKQEDDPRLEQVIASLEAQSSELRKLTEVLAQQRDELLSQRDALASQRDLLTSQRDLLTSNIEAQRLQLIAVEEREEQTRHHCNNLVAKLNELSTVALERDRLARELADSMGGSSSLPPGADSVSVSELRSRYLDLIESALSGTLYKDPPLPVFGNDKFDANARSRGLDWPQNAFSMVGVARLRNLRNSVERVLQEQVPGDIVETGVWRGGASILARAVLASYGAHDRKVILCDSFEGLPPPDESQFPADTGSTFHEHPELAVSLEQVKGNFDVFGLLDEQVVFLKGWFKDTMPHVPSKQISVLRLDGDMYESTIDPLNHLFEKVSPGGFVIIDDYEYIPACKAAVQDFLTQRDLKIELQPIDGIGVYFRKR